MIEKNIDIWAVLLLLFAFALFTRVDNLAVRTVCAGLSLYQQHVSVAVHVPQL